MKKLELDVKLALDYEIGNRLNHIARSRKHFCDALEQIETRFDSPALVPMDHYYHELAHE